jgi:hypothetical protein
VNLKLKRNEITVKRENEQMENETVKRFFSGTKRNKIFLETERNIWEMEKKY